MAKLALIIISCLPSVTIKISWPQMFDALAYVESNHGKNTVSAISQRDNSIGVYQIRPIYVRDVNRILGKKKFALRDRYDKRKSEQMIKTLTTHYIKMYHLSLTAENIARIHNGGAMGWKRYGTLEYWKKVRAYLLRRIKR